MMRKRRDRRNTKKKISRQLWRAMAVLVIGLVLIGQGNQQGLFRKLDAWSAKYSVKWDDFWSDDQPPQLHTEHLQEDNYLIARYHHKQGDYLLMGFNSPSDFDRQNLNYRLIQALEWE